MNKPAMPATECQPHAPPKQHNISKHLWKALVLIIKNSVSEARLILLSGGETPGRIKFIAYFGSPYSAITVFYIAVKLQTPESSAKILSPS